MPKHVDGYHSVNSSSNNLIFDAPGSCNIILAKMLRAASQDIIVVAIIAIDFMEPFGRGMSSHQKLIIFVHSSSMHSAVTNIITSPIYRDGGIAYYVDD